VPAPKLCVISAKTGTGLAGLCGTILRLYESWNAKIKTNALNNWLKQRTTQNPPPLFKGREVKIKYISQTKIRPPSFTVFTNFKDGLPVGYLRYLSNSLAKDFGLDGVAARFFIQETENPYSKKSKERLTRSRPQTGYKQRSKK
jgi:GTP-binding protein